ncbi:MAG: hypothetical protein IH840_15875 [Candidatus Heimdallarchaeota archaeon]|nr:hypothetical protein [Candidatus Heimdallarchaeota archaeon]
MNFFIPSTLSPENAEKWMRVIVKDNEIYDYIINITHGTRENPNIDIPASPRASIALFRLGKTSAAIKGREYVQPDDVKQVAFNVLNHRIGLSHEAELDRISLDEVIDGLLSAVEVAI